MIKTVVFQMVLSVAKPVFNLVIFLCAVDFVFKRQSLRIVGIKTQHFVDFLQGQLVFTFSKPMSSAL